MNTEFNVILNIIDNYPDVRALCNLSIISKDVNAFILSSVNHLIIPSYAQSGKKCLIKTTFLKKFPHLKHISLLNNVSELGKLCPIEKDSKVGARAILRGEDFPDSKVKDIGNLYLPDDENIHNNGNIPDDESKEAGLDEDHQFFWYNPALGWENEKKHLRNISLLQYFVHLCQNAPEGTEYVLMTKNGIFCTADPYTWDFPDDQMMAYSISHKTLYNKEFAPYDLDDKIISLFPKRMSGEESSEESSGDEDKGSVPGHSLVYDEGEGSQAVLSQIYARYRAYLRILSNIEIKNMNDMCLRFVYNISDDIGVIEMFKDLEGVVCVDFYNDEDAVIVQDLLEIFEYEEGEKPRRFLEIIKHYYLLSFDGEFVSYINDATAEACQTISTMMDNIFRKPLTWVLTFPDVDEDNIECTREILPNANVKGREIENEEEGDEDEEENSEEEQE